MDIGVATALGELIGPVLVYFLAVPIIGAAVLLFTSVVRFASNKSGGSFAVTFLTAVLFLALPAGFLYWHSSGFQTVPKKTDVGNVESITSSDGLITLKLPSHWSRQTDLHEDATIQIGVRDREEYLIIVTDQKSDFDGTLDEHSAQTIAFLLSNLRDSVRGAPLRFKLNGMNAIQYEISGQLDGNEIVYLHTTLETRDAYHQVIGWTAPSHRSANRKVYMEVLNTIEPRDGLPVGWSGASHNEIEQRVREEISKLFGKPIEEIKPTHDFEEDFGAEDADFVTLISATEEAFDIAIPGESADEIVIVDDLIHCVKRALQE